MPGRARRGAANDAARWTYVHRFQTRRARAVPTGAYHWRHTRRRGATTTKGRAGRRLAPLRVPPCYGAEVKTAAAPPVEERPGGVPGGLCRVRCSLSAPRGAAAGGDARRGCAAVECKG